MIIQILFSYAHNGDGELASPQNTRNFRDIGWLGAEKCSVYGQNTLEF